MSGEVSKTKSADRVHRLTELDVKEVSLVDRPAIDRTFLVTKRHEPSSGANMATPISSAQRTFLTKSEPIIRAITTERLDLIIKALDKLQDTELTKQQVRDELSSVFSNLYAVDSDLTALAKSCQDEGLLPGDFDFDLAKGLNSDDDADAEKKKAADAKAKKEKDEADAKAKKEKDEADAKAKEESTQKAGGIAADLLEAIGVVTPLLDDAATQDAAPTEQIKRVSAFLAKVAVTGEIAKGLTAENVEKGSKHMTPTRMAELKATHSGLGNLIAIFETGKSADGDDESTTDTKKSESTDSPALVETLKSLQTAINTFSDRLTVVEHTRKSASGEENEDTAGSDKKPTEKGAVDWSGIIQKRR